MPTFSGLLFEKRAGGRPSGTGLTIDCEEQWPFEAQGKRLARKRKAVASENEEPDRNDPAFVPCI